MKRKFLVPLFVFASVIAIGCGRSDEAEAEEIATSKAALTAGEQCFTPYQYSCSGGLIYLCTSSSGNPNSFFWISTGRHVRTCR